MACSHRPIKKQAEIFMITNYDEHATFMRSTTPNQSISIIQNTRIKHGYTAMFVYYLNSM